LELDKPEEIMRSIASRRSRARAMAAKPSPIRVHERNVRSLAWWSRSCEPLLATR
jgi:hypothetical protein